MILLDRTLATPAENLGCDQVLLDQAEERGSEELLRFWNADCYFVVLGYSRPSSADVRLDECARHGIPVLRRSSGGGTILQGPGCLNYALVLRITPDGPTSNITRTTRHVMDRHARVLQRLLGEPVERMGGSDLVAGGKKFSGNAQRRGERFVLFHGTFLLRFDLPLISRYLTVPSRQPAYRENREHEDFVRSVGLEAETVKRALAEEWGAVHSAVDVPQERIRELVRLRYEQQQWIYRVL